MFVFVSLIVLVGVGFWWLRLPANYSVQRTQIIAVESEVAYRYVADFANWTQWSPWQMHDLKTINQFERPSEVGGYFTWQSPLIGQGRMTHVAQQAPQRLEMLIEFIKPFSSRAQVSFEFMSKGAGQTEVVWIMQARLPWFMRPMCQTMTRMIGMDFEMGLALLAGRLDPNFDGPRVEFVGVVERAEQRVLAQRYEGSLDHISSVMKNTYPALITQAGTAANGAPLAAYWRVNAKRNTVVCDIALPVDASMTGATMTLAGGRYFQVRYRGPYRYMPHAWHNAMGHLRMQKLHFNKRRAGLEVYTTQPDPALKPQDQITDLFVPV